MPTRILIQHHTKYVYGNPVSLSPHLFRLKPAAHSRISVEAYSLIIKPKHHVIHWQQDPFGNFLARADFTGPLQELVIDVKIMATVTKIDPFDFFIDTYAQQFAFDYEAQLKKDLSPYLEVTESGPVLMQWLLKIDRSPQEIVAFVVMVNQMVFKDIAYTTRMQPGVQSSEESLEMALGSCRDSAWLLVQALRHVGLAARFVSGYLVQLADDANASAEPVQDTASLHAWAEVYVPGAGWIGLDPTSGLLTAEQHIPLACTPAPAAAAPVSGTSGVSDTAFTYTNTVTRF